MSKYMVDSSDLTSIADAIRSKAGTDAPLEFPDEFVSAINNSSVMEDYDSEFVFKLTAATLTVNLYLTQSSPNAVTVNWGDGSEPEQSSDLLANFSHTYASADNYAVKVICKDGEVWCPGGTFNSTDYCLLGDASTGHSTLISAVFGKNTNLNNTKCMRNCNGMTWVKISKHVTDIGTDAFVGCSQLKEIHIDDIDAWFNITFQNRNGAPLMIGHYLYLNDELVTDVVCPSSVTDVTSNIFAGCYSLRHVTFQEQITSIGASSFSGCKNLNNFTLPNSVTSLGSAAFGGCTGLTRIVMPDSITYIGSYAFQSCTGLTDITISSSLTSFDNAIFAGCTGLTSIAIPETMTGLGAQDFENCTGLTEVTILSPKFRGMGTSAFKNCTSLMSLTCYAINPPNMTGNPLQNVPANCNIYVPAQSVEAYKAATYWSARADYIQAVPQE